MAWHLKSINLYLYNLKIIQHFSDKKLLGQQFTNLYVNLYQQACPSLQSFSIRPSLAPYHDVDSTTRKCGCTGQCVVHGSETLSKQHLRSLLAFFPQPADCIQRSRPHYLKSHLREVSSCSSLVRRVFCIDNMLCDCGHSCSESQSLVSHTYYSLLAQFLYTTLSIISNYIIIVCPISIVEQFLQCTQQVNIYNRCILL